MFSTLIKARPRCTVAVVLALSLAGPALAAAPLQEKSIGMQCADRKIVVEAACFHYAGSIMACTRQAIRFLSADGKQVGARAFTAKPLKGADYPVIPEQFGELNCVETKAKEKYVVATMDNGGNCDQCEWNDVYSLDGTFVGSTLDKKKANASFKAAIDAAYDQRVKHVLTHQPLHGLYENTGTQYVCPVKNIAPKKVTQEMGYAVLDALNKAFDAALGPDARRVDQPKVVGKLAASHVDDAKMMALADVSGCAALIDVDSSCSLYYDPELGNPLSVFMGMKKSAPLRKQFEEAVARVPDPAQRRAAQTCIKLVGKR